MSNIRSFTAPEASQGCTSDQEPPPGRISSCHSDHGPLPTQTKGLTKAMWLGHFRPLLDLQPHLTALWAQEHKPAVSLACRPLSHPEPPSHVVPEPGQLLFRLHVSVRMPPL